MTAPEGTTLVLAATLAHAASWVREHPLPDGEPFMCCGLGTTRRVRGLTLARVLVVGLCADDVQDFMNRPGVVPSWMHLHALPVEYVR